MRGRGARLASVALALAVAIAVGGCGGGPSLPAFEKQAKRVSCEAIFRCCDANVTRLYGADVASCTATQVSRIDTSVADDALQKGLLRYDAGLASQCLDAQRAALANCDAPIQPVAPDPCGRVSTGLVASGGDCDQRVKECVDGFFCLGTNGPPAPGACRIESQLGESCLDVPCIDSLACDATRVCIQPIPDGAACTLARECQSRACVNGACAPVPTVRQAICH